MPRPSIPLVALIAVATSIAGLLAGCATPGPIADPREIVSRSAAAVAAARSFQYVATLEGEIPLPPVGAAEAAPFDLDGTTVDGSVDVVGEAATAALGIPGLGPVLDAVVVGPDLYVNVPLLGGGYRRTAAAGSPLAILSDPESVLAAIDDALGSLPEPPRKEADRDCLGTNARCYVVVLQVPPGSAADIPGILGGLIGGAVGGSGLGGLSDLTAGAGIPFPSLDPALATGGGTAELLVRIDDLRPYSLTLRGASDAAPSMTVTFGGWDESVTIAAPTG